MDALLIEAAWALRRGDPLGALKRVALRADPEALALRGTALAQLGDLAKAKELLRRAGRAFGKRAPLSRARCGLAEAEIALASRELDGTGRRLEEARRLFAAHSDAVNARYAQLLQARLALLLGKVDAAAAALEALELQGAPAMLRAVADLVAFDVALRRGSTHAAQEALARARDAAGQARIPALEAELEQLARTLELPAATLFAGGDPRPVRLAEVEATLASDLLVVDACRRAVQRGPRRLALTSRPVLFTLVQTLAEAWPKEVSREQLIERAFEAKRINDSHRARLRVELGRLRALLGGLAKVRATFAGFMLEPEGAKGVRVIAPPAPGADAAVLALLADGERWSTSSLARALGVSARTVQRSLALLAESGKVSASGRGRGQRWIAAPLGEITTLLLLPHHL